VRVRKSRRKSRRGRGANFADILQRDLWRPADLLTLAEAMRNKLLPPGHVKTFREKALAILAAPPRSFLQDLLDFLKARTIIGTWWFADVETPDGNKYVGHMTYYDDSGVLNYVQGPPENNKNRARNAVLVTLVQRYYCI